MVRNGLDLVFLFAVHDVRCWSGEVDSVLGRLMIRGQQTSVEDVMNGPGRGELQAVSDWRNDLCDREGSMTFGGQFERLIREV